MLKKWFIVLSACQPGESNLADPNCLQFLAIQVIQRMHAMHVQPVSYEHSL